MRWQSRIIGLLLTLGVTARLLWFFYDPSLWNDEAALVNSIVRYGPFRLIARPLDGLQIAPPGYLLLEKLTGGLGGYSEASLRVVSLVCGIVALALFIVLARSWLSGWGRVAAIALFSLSGPLIYHSSEAKQYEAAVLVTILLLVIAFRWRTQWSPVRALAAGVLGMIGILLASTAIFVLVGAFGVLALDFLFTRRWRQAAYVGTGLALAGGAFLLEYVLLFRHNPNVQVMNAYWAPHFAPLPLSAADLRWYVRTGFFALITPLGLSLDLLTF